MTRPLALLATLFLAVTAAADPDPEPANLPVVPEVETLHGKDPITVEVRRGSSTCRIDGEDREVGEIFDAIGRAAAGSRDDDHLRGVSRRPVVVHADADAPFAVVGQVVLACLGESVPRLAFAARTPDGRRGVVPVPIPDLDEHVGPRTEVEATLHRVRGETVIRSADGRIPAGPIAKAGDPLDAALAALAERAPVPVLRIAVPANVDVGDVVRLAARARRAGLSGIHLAVRDRSDEAVLVALRFLPGRGSLRAIRAVPKAVRKELRLPDAAGGVRAKNEAPVIEVAATADGKVWCEGRPVTPRELRERLGAVAIGHRDVGGGMVSASRAGVLLTADERVPWMRIQWILQTAADPDVMIARIHWNVRRPDGSEAQLRMFLPTDRGIVDGPPVRDVVLEVSPGPRGDARLSIRRLSDDKEIWAPEGDDPFTELREVLAKARKRWPEMTVRVNALGTTPYGAVARACGAALAAGFPSPTLIGAVPPRGDAWTPR